MSSVATEVVDGTASAALTVRRWQRYGADRLFVTCGNGTPVGSVDLQSGSVDAGNPDLEGEVRRAAQVYLHADLPELVVPAGRWLAPADAARRAPRRAGSHWRDGVPCGRAGTVGERLERLADEGWVSVHDVPLGRQGACVEHLLIGPGGLFTVTERWHPGLAVVGRGHAMTVAGRPVAYLRDARLEAARVTDRLLAVGCAQLHVRAVLVLTGELDVEAPATPADPLVVARREVPGCFRRMPVVLDERRVRAVAKVARRAATWLGGA